MRTKPKSTGRVTEGRVRGRQEGIHRWRSSAPCPLKMSDRRLASPRCRAEWPPKTASPRKTRCVDSPVLRNLGSEACGRPVSSSYHFSATVASRRSTFTSGQSDVGSSNRVDRCAVRYRSKKACAYEWSRRDYPALARWPAVEAHSRHKHDDGRAPFAGPMGRRCSLWASSMALSCGPSRIRARGCRRI